MAAAAAVARSCGVTLSSYEPNANITASSQVSRRKVRFTNTVVKPGSSQTRSADSGARASTAK